MCHSQRKTCIPTAIANYSLLLLTDLWQANVCAWVSISNQTGSWLGTQLTLKHQWLLGPFSWS